jgi:ABC-2 type transport system ATP-binding protein
MAHELAIETRRLTREFDGRVAVDGIDLAVPRGSVYGFLGPNGAGKTTTIRMLLGLLAPSRGEIRMGGHPFTRDDRQLLRGVGALVEAPSVYPHLTGRENLEVTARLLSVPGIRVTEVLACSS